MRLIVARMAARSAGGFFAVAGDASNARPTRVEVRTGFMRCRAFVQATPACTTATLRRPTLPASAKGCGAPREWDDDHQRGQSDYGQEPRREIAEVSRERGRKREDRRGHDAVESKGHGSNDAD